VGSLRVAAGRHFPTDVLVGALAGSAIGMVIPWAHARRTPVTVALAPHADGAFVTLTVAPR
jgi:membrane-associated phospholipid phosphatase